MDPRRPRRDSARPTLATQFASAPSQPAVPCSTAAARAATRRRRSRRSARSGSSARTDAARMASRPGTRRSRAGSQTRSTASAPSVRWYVGRPLLVTENDYELRLYNGDTGVVVRTAPTASAPRSSAAARWSSSARPGWRAVDTVYAMTIHKSQGSQFETAAVLLPGPTSRILTRELALHGRDARTETA